MKQPQAAQCGKQNLAWSAANVPEHAAAPAQSWSRPPACHRCGPCAGAGLRPAVMCRSRPPACSNPCFFAKKLVCRPAGAANWPQAKGTHLGPNSALWGVTVHGSHANGLFWPRRRPPLVGAGGANFQKNAANFQHFLEDVPVCLLELAYACRPVGKCIQIGHALGQAGSAWPCTALSSKKCLILLLGLAAAGCCTACCCCRPL